MSAMYKLFLLLACARGWHQDADEGDQCYEGDSMQALQLTGATTSNATPCNFVNCNNDRRNLRCRHYRQCIPTNLKHRTYVTPQGRRTYCEVFKGYLTDPAVYFSGSEEIQTGTKKAADWDWIWDAARFADGCNGDGQGLQLGCALLCNPKCKRGQDQLHIHNRPLSARGRAFRNYLSTMVVYDDSKWREVKAPTLRLYARKFCSGTRSSAWAGFWGFWPNVFSAVKETQYFKERGGITIWPVEADKGGRHPRGWILMMTSCNIEKDIFATSGD
mmetsp:Transcript_60687/g.113400  ORF Transcript_60687/g.113400 Transcript_60687/m.113400 type:complete len:274 (-) Transcript_60687:243-1064(-)